MDKFNTFNKAAIMATAIIAATNISIDFSALKSGEYVCYYYDEEKDAISSCVRYIDVYNKMEDMPKNILVSSRVKICYDELLTRYATWLLDKERITTQQYEQIFYRL